MHVERIPEGGMNDVPDVPQEPALLIDAGRRHHEADPGIRQEHEQCPDHVQDHGHAQVNPLEEPFLHFIPAVVIDINGSALRHKHQRIDMHDRAEDTGEIAEECRIERQEGEDQDTAQNSGDRIGRQTDFDEVIGELVVPLRHRLILRHHPHEFNNHAENRDREHETSVIEVLLVRKPEQHAALEVVPRIILRTIDGLRSRGTDDDTLSLIIDVSPLLDLRLTLLLHRIRCIRANSQ